MINESQFQGGEFHSNLDVIARSLGLLQFVQLFKISTVVDTEEVYIHTLLYIKTYLRQPIMLFFFAQWFLLLKSLTS